MFSWMGGGCGFVVLFGSHVLLRSLGKDQSIAAFTLDLSHSVIQLLLVLISMHCARDLCSSLGMLGVWRLCGRIIDMRGRICHSGAI